MAASSDLFELIQALTPSEKRYFRSYAFRHVIGEENRYFQLFQAINAQDRYDESALLEQFEGAAFTRQFSVAKNYLTQLILQSLREFHRGKNFNLRMREHLDHFELLFDKGLFRHCHKLLRKAEKLARSREAFSYLYELKVLQKRLVKREDPVRSRKLLPELSLEEAHWLDQARLQSELRRIHDQVFALVARVGLIRSDAQREELAGILTQVTVSSAEEVEGFETRIIYHYIYAYAARLQGKVDKVLERYQAMVNLWEAHPQWQAEFPERYIRTLIANLDTHLQAGEYDQFENAIDKVRAVEVKSLPLQAQVFYFTHVLELRYFLNTRDLARARTRMTEVKTGFATFEPHLGPDLQIILAYNLACLYFLSGIPGESLQWTNHILNQSSGSVRRDILRGARMLDLCNHYSRGNFDYIESLHQSTLRFLKLDPGDHRFETSLVKGIWRVSKQAEPELGTLHQELTALLRDPAEEVLGGEEVLLWLEALEKGVPLAEHYQSQSASTK